MAGKTNGEAYMSQYPRTQNLDTACASCHNLLKNTKYCAGEYLEHMRWLANASACEKLAIDQEFVLGNLKSISQRCMQREAVLTKKGEHVVIEDENGDLAHAWTFNAAGALRANELLGKELGMFKDRVEHDASDPLRDIMERIGRSREGASPLPSGE